MNIVKKIGHELLLLTVGYIASFPLILVHFESLRILVQPKDSNMCFHSYENSYHGAKSKVIKKIYFQFTSYINLSDVFLLSGME